MSYSIEKDYKTHFSSLLEDLKQQLLSAQSSLDILKGLVTDLGVVDVLNKYRGFFTPTIYAHRDLLFIKLCNVMDKKGRAPGLYRILKMVDEHKDVGAGVDIPALCSRLEKHEDILRRIKNFRDTRAAHWDTEVAESIKEIRFDEISSLLKEIEAIFNEIHRAHIKGATSSFKDFDHDDVAHLIEKLKK